MSGPLRLAIVGLGKMGRLHCATWQRLAGVRLAALVDPDPTLADWAASQGASFFADCRELPGQVDLAVIASPSARHRDNALPLLAAGIPCLVEKPLALDVADCQALVQAARQSGTLLAIGHSERFNPVIQRLRTTLGTRPAELQVTRVVPRPTGLPAPDADVVQDLMVHDLDWLLASLGLPLQRPQVLEWRRQHGQLSHVRCRLEFAGDCQVELTACRDGEQRQRQVRIRSGAQATVLVELDSPCAEREPDALTRQAQAFLLALRGHASVIALGHEALAVMALGDDIRRHCQAVGESVCA